MRAARGILGSAAGHKPNRTAAAIRYEQATADGRAVVPAGPPAGCSL